MAKILFISDLNVFEPFNGGGICVQRHIKRLLEAGWTIDWLIPANLETSAARRHPSAKIFIVNNNALRLPSRLTFARDLPIFSELEACLMHRPMKDQITSGQYDGIIIILNANLIPLATRISRNNNLPLSVIVYDEREVRQGLNTRFQAFLYRQTRILFKQASRIWFITPEIRQRYADRDAAVDNKKARYLLPIPGSYAASRKKPINVDIAAPTYIYAGDIHQGQHTIIRSIATRLRSNQGRVVLLCPSRRHELFKEDKKIGLPIKLFPPRASPRSAFKFISESASVIIACYAPTADQPMAFGSLPSKILEYSSIGIPILIIAPSEAAVFRWATGYNWPCLVETGDEKALYNMMTRLTSRDFWNSASSHIHSIASEAFDPGKIHARFQSEIILQNSKDSFTAIP